MPRPYPLPPPYTPNHLIPDDDVSLVHLEIAFNQIWNGNVVLNANGTYIVDPTFKPRSKILVLLRGTSKVVQCRSLIGQILGNNGLGDDIIQRVLDGPAYHHPFFNRPVTSSKFFFIHREHDGTLLNNRVDRQVLDPAVIASAIQG